jgi:hypothetical protein
MNSKREEFLARVREVREKRRQLERYKLCIGKSVSKRKLEDSQFTSDPDDCTLYKLWFPATRQPTQDDGCCYMNVDLCVQLTIEGDILQSVSVWVHLLDKMGKGRSFEPQRIEPGDAETISSIVEGVVED